MKYTIEKHLNKNKFTIYQYFKNYKSFFVFTFPTVYGEIFKIIDNK